MFIIRYLLLFPALFLMFACQKDDQNTVVTQKYIHKYGFDLTQQEWNERDQEGQIVTYLKDRTILTENYENGILHGSTTLTYPNSSIIQKELVYDQGALLKEIINDECGLPIKEEVYEFDDKKIITYWFDNGAPMSIEEYDNNTLIEASYFDFNNELEASVEEGKGSRVRRDRAGNLLIAESIENGIVTCRKAYHPNGQVQSISFFNNYQLHGPQKKYTLSGKPLLEQNFNNGVLHGIKTHFKNGKKVAETPYVNGEKDGIEKHFDQHGTLVAEIPWESNEKHGKSRYQYEDFSDLQWYFRGRPVSKEKFTALETREQILAELSLDNDAY